ncbi:MAG: hypothetical protein JEZ09_03530 [Salinivirgaceae bacterium]|nr:hypothetical protein [Salinivirgaceae bacterium]
MIHKRLLLFLISIIAGIHLFGFDFDYRFKNLTIDDGLPQNSVLCVFQDSKGFIWFGTFNGVCRLQGADIKVFVPHADDQGSINDGSVYDICEDFEGNIYLATNGGGLNVYNPKTEKFSYYLSDSSEHSIIDNSLYDVFLAADSTIWIAGYNGVSRFFPKTKRFKSFYYDAANSEELFNYSAFGIAEDSDGDIWIASGGGVAKYEKEKDNFKFFKNNIEVEEKYNSNFILDIECYDTYYFLLATKAGIYKFNIQDTSFSIFYKGDYQAKDIFIDRDKNVWIGTNGNGLIRIDKNKETVVFQNDPNNDYSLPDNRINYIYQDNNKIYWLGLGSKGIGFFKSDINRFYHYYKIDNENSLIGNDVFGLAEDGNGNVWIATVNGLSIFDPKTKVFNNLTEEDLDRSIRYNQIYDVFYDTSGYMWIAYDTGVDKYSFKEDKYYSYQFVTGDSTSLPNDNIFCIKSDKNGDIWMGTYFGLARYNKLTDDFTQYLASANDNSSISNNVIWNMFSDSKGRLWIGTSNGLDRYDFVNDKFLHFDANDSQLSELNEIEINYITEDSDGFLWVSTPMGLYKVDVDNGKLKHFGQKDGLPDQMIYGIVDYGDDIWFTSNKGLSQMNKNTFEIANYDVNDGLQSNEFNIATLKLSNNIIMFGGINGITAFDPETIKRSERIPEIYFTELSLNGNVVKPNEIRFNKIPLAQSIIDANKINLSFKEKLIQIEFNALEYLVSDKIKYAYRFLPNSKEWIELGNTKSVTFTNLNPGKYSLEIKSTNSDQVWCDNVKAIQIQIYPPFYKRKGVLFLDVIIAAIIILLIIRRRINKVKKANIRLEKIVVERTEEVNSQNEELRVQRDKIAEQKEKIEKSAKELEKKVQKRTKQLEEAKDRAEESDRLKSAFLANMSHEIRTPMNAIVGFSDLLTSNEIPEDEKKSFLELIKVNSESLLALLNDILDISIIESGKIYISKKKFNVEKLVDEVYASFLCTKSYKEKPLVKLELLKCNELEIMLYNDALRIKQVLNNLIGNAIKYTSVGSVKVSYMLGNNQIVFKVQDTGIGIFPDDLKRIFDRFHKIGDYDTNPYRGGGLGLAISRSLAELMGGKIWVESEPNIGSTFYFSIPELVE